MRAWPLLLTLAACRDFPCGEDELLREDGSCVPRDPDPTDSSDDSDDSDDSDHDSEAPWVTLPSSCEPPSSLPVDVLTLVGSNKQGQEKPGEGFFVELLDLELDGDRLYGVGQGGLMVYDISSALTPTLLSYFPPDGHGRYHRVERIGDQILALSHRDRGIQIVDLSDLSKIRVLSELNRAGLEGMAWSAPYLFATDREKGLVVLDLSDPAAPVELGAAAGLSAPWELSPLVDGWSYIADNTAGVVPADLRDPTRPLLHPAVALPGATQHTAVEGDWVYAAIGGAGVAVLDRSDPAAPVLVTTVETGGSATQVAAIDGVLWVVDHEGVLAFDIADPRAPQPIAQEQTEQFALALRAASRNQVWVGDWNILSGWALNREKVAPELDPSTDTLRLPAEGGRTQLTLTNRGADTLTLHGALVADPRVTVQVSRDSVPSGETAILTLSWEGGESLESTLCIASNDPDGPTQTLTLTAGAVGDYLGQAAPDFALQTLDGDTLRLSEQLGYPVLLVYFATW